MSDTVTISKEEYADLLVCQDKLIRLENAGVDNWEGYSEGIFPDEGESWPDAAKRIRAGVEVM